MTLLEIEDETPVSRVDRSVIVNDVALVVFAQPTHPRATTSSSVRRDAVASFPFFITDPSGDYHDRECGRSIRRRGSL